VEVHEQTGPAILLVSDDVLVRNYLNRELSAGRHKVFAAANSSEAFHLVSSLPGRIRLAVAALEGECGMEFAQRLTNECGIRAVVVCTATLAELNRAAVSNPCDCIPEQPSTLLRVVDWALSHADSGAGPVIA